MYSHIATKRTRRTIALAASVAVMLVGLGATPASADAPINFTDSMTYTSVNPCTGVENELTFSLDVSVHVHQNNVVAHIERSGESSDGYLMTGVETAVETKNVFRAGYNDQWVDSDGSRFRNRAHITINLNKGEVLVDNFELSCLGN